MGAAVQHPAFYARRGEYVPLPRPVTEGRRPYGPNTIDAWPYWRLIYEHDFTPAEVDKMTITEILNIGEAIDVMFDVNSPPKED